MNVDEQPSSNNDPLSRTTKDLDQENLLALVSVRPPTPDKCAVCLNNKQTDIIARIDSCSHTFCFSCILEWSKVRAICPLCKQPFSVITRERYSGDIVEEICVQTPRRPSRQPPNFTNLNDILNWFDARHRGTDTVDNTRRDDIFRQMVYVEWLNTIQSLVRRPNNTLRTSTQSTLARSTNSSSWANIIPLDSIRRLLHRYLRQTTSELRQSTIYSQSTRQTVAFRKYVYIHRLFVRSPLVGHNLDTLSVRECSPTWYASNPACLHRLVPFLARELLALLWNDERTIENAIQEILTAIQLHEIRSSFLARKLNEYLGRYTKHFIHEFYTFARCPYDLAGFDCHAQYSTMNPSPPVRSPMEISLDDDENDDGNEETPIIIDETNDGSTIDTIDIVSSPQTITTTESEHQSSSPECEIVEYVEPSIARTPSLIVLSEDEDEDEDENEDEDEDDDDDNENNNDSQVQVSSSTKRKYNHGHNNRCKKQQTTSIIEIDSPTSVIVDDDDDDEPQRTNSNQEQLTEEENQQ
ncbi:unnamed protein product [Rotaria socialis]|uniref:RING-type E3 ubiquitin transferase n=1 Tax=Rotaria socialis TaxID=392032 RepID=A0A820NMF4_9BILA|nr:unnamed protein product [Rotaria socialis]CAF3619127.1 unnamed protein product [Rotaria socialis]CAF4390117.1 unnamed protein product [Rotaria socialis]CAF4525538.1 unnamed protein product [Rotaria socialis]